MKIGLVLDHFDPQRGGVEQWTLQFARHLIALKHEVHVIASGFGSDVGRCGVISHPFRNFRSKLQRAQAAEDVLEPLQLDVIHDMGVGWYCDILQPHGGSRRAAFEQNLLLEPKWKRPAKRLAARVLPRYREFEALTARQYSGDRRIVLALSEMVKSDLRRYHDVDERQIRLIYNGVDTQRFSPDFRPQFRDKIRRQLGLDSQVLYLIVAHNLKLKGVPALLRAAGILAKNQKEFHIAIVGGKRIGPYRRLAEQLGVSHHVTFVDAVDDPVPYYAAADVYVQPTFYDPCSLVVLEAFACGLPVITTRFNGAGELMTPGEHGFVMDDPNNAEQLADFMRTLLDGRKRDKMMTAARQLALRNSFQSNVSRILDVYREVIDGKQQRFAA